MRDDPERSVADDLRQWLDGDATAPGPPTAGADVDPPRRRRPARVVALVGAILAAWALAAALIVVGRDAPVRPTSRPALSAPAPSPAVHLERADATPAPSATTPSRPPATGVPGDPTQASPPAAVAPTAVRLVRDAATHGAGPETSAVDVAAAEQPRRVADGTWLVRVHAVVLHGDRRRWHRSTHDVWAVPIGRRGGRLVGLEHPWRVATGDGRVARTAWPAATVDPAAVRAALRRAGLTAPSDLEVERHPTEPTIIRASTRGAPAVWLRQGQALEVLGATSATGAP